MINGQISLFDGTSEFKINKPIRLIELFAGYGSQNLALKYLGINYVSWKICEWAVKSIQAYKDLHHSEDNKDYAELNGLGKVNLEKTLFDFGISADYNEPMTMEQIKRLGFEKQKKIFNNIMATNNLVNIQKTNAVDLEIVDTDKYDYLMTYSFPCLTNDSLILTREGYKQLQDINVGDYVLTKSNTWQKVYKKFNNGKHKTVYLQGMNFENIHCTLNHKFYVREKYKVWDNKNRRYKRMFKQPIFKEVKDITKNDYFGVPIIKEEIDFYTKDKDFWYIIGYYLGDGWLSKTGYEVNFACNNNKLLKIQPVLQRLGIKYTVYKDITCYKLRFSNQEFYNFINENIGTGCNNKNLSGNILTLPKQYLKQMLYGYKDSDGCIIDGKFQFTSINRQLCYGVAAIINKVYHRAVSFNKTIVHKTKIIQNRLVNQKDWYLLRFNPKNNKQDKAFYENGYIWYPFNKITEGEEENVYNMEIENDHSYIVQGCISKNCQDLSLAGKGKGMSRDGGTRSGMLWEVERILNECEELPQILLMENVPQVHGKGNMQHFVEWQEFLESKGYKNYWQDLNAKDYGIPQSRNRTFMISLLGDYRYEFPKKIKLEKRLKDLLEDSVDEKYFLSEKMINYALSSGTGKYKAPAKLTNDIACALTTKQDKRAGITNYIKDPKLVVSETICINSKVNGKQPSLQDRIYDENGISTALTTGFHPSILVDESVKQSVALNFEKEKDSIANSEKEIYQCDVNSGWQDNKIGLKISPTLRASSDSTYCLNNQRIRKLTPKECWRLMGVKDTDFELVSKNQSNMSLYHLAGDSIVVNVLMEIFKKMIKGE